jgi:hypothetical protein
MHILDNNIAVVVVEKRFRSYCYEWEAALRSVSLALLYRRRDQFSISAPRTVIYCSNIILLRFYLTVALI